MNFNPFDHLDELVLDNIPGGPPYADPNYRVTPETLAFTLRGQAISHDQAFAQYLWLTFAYGADLNAGLSRIYEGVGASGFTITADRLLSATGSLPHLAAYAAEDVLSFALSAAPEIVLVGQAHTGT